VLTDVVGGAADLGVECLRGSGCIAGETSRAYNDVFTLTYVSGRTVGIGAYLARCGAAPRTAGWLLLRGPHPNISPFPSLAPA
jgi:hypothetical protein